MTNFTYINNIPNGPDNPSDDQPNMKTNTNSISDIIDVDHIGFGQANGGYHRQNRIIARNTIPGGLFPGMGTFYVKVVDGEEQVFYTAGANGTEYQITRSIQGSFSAFSANPGWTFLPGGLLLQYGLSAANPVVFPTAFTSTPFSIQITRNSSSGLTTSLPVVTVSNTQFTTNNAPGFFFWMAIGK